MADANPTRSVSDPEATRSYSGPGDPGPAPALRYRVLKAHARGGLGEVFLAEDLELNRKVALKEIQERHAHDPSSRGRFVREAEITGGLEHPGIVPVYGLGRYADGRPYYAMRFIQGDNLKEAIGTFHAAAAPPEGRGGRFQSLEFRRLLGRFVAVCNAVEYAHSRGVLHRDLKPGNIMLGRFGETLVVDWGLAKPMGSTPAAGDGINEEMLRPASGDLESTQAGVAVGTPAYMSPEQAAGRPEELGPASDVYSLGATLYCLLTGRAPYEKSEPGPLLERVRQGRFEPPRRVKPAVPPALEAVCLKAMAACPADRYASPRALADDLDRWLADEPVTAYREPLRARAGRWMRRHRTGVTSAVAALAVAAVCLGVATWLLTAAYREVEQQRNDARSQSHKARARLLMARKAVDRFYTEVSESKEMKARGVEKLRLKLLQGAVEFYEQFATEEDEGDIEVQTEQGRTYLRLADLYQELGRPREAAEAFEKSLALYQRMVADHPAASTFPCNVAYDENHLGELHEEAGRLDEAERCYQVALTIYGELCRVQPDVPKHLDNACVTRSYLANLYRRTNRPGPAEKLLQEALAAEARLTTGPDPDPEIVSNESAFRHSLAMVYEQTGRAQEAEKLYEASRDAAQRLVDLHPDKPMYHVNLSVDLASLGERYAQTGRFDQAEKVFRQAHVYRKQLAETHPEVPVHTLRLSDICRNLAELERRRGRDEVAVDWWAQAIEPLEALRRKQPQQAGTRGRLRHAHGQRGASLVALGRHAEADREWEQALALADGDDRLRVRCGRATALARAGDHARALAEVGELASERAMPAALGCALAADCSDLAASFRADADLAEQYAAHAVRLLTQAAAAGYFGEPATRQRLQNDPRFAPLQSRADFKRLLTELDGKPGAS